MQKIYYYIYQITNKLNGKIYIGVHKTLDMDDGYMGSGKLLKYAIKKYGIENFEKTILKHFKSEQEMFKEEVEIVTEDFIKRKDVYNIAIGGCGGCISKGLVTVKDADGSIFVVSKTDPRYLSGALVGVTRGMATVKDGCGNTFNVSKTDPRYLSGELKVIWDGKKHAPETIEKMRLSAKGRYDGDKNPQYGKMWIYSDELQISKRIQNDDAIPVGWKKGRKIKFHPILNK